MRERRVVAVGGGIVVLLYVAVVLATRRLAGWDAENPAWLLCLSFLTGLAVAFISQRPDQPGPSASSAWTMTFLLLVFTGRQLIVLFIGAAFIGVGGLGVLTGRLDLKGRRGPRRISTGRSAQIKAALLMVFGGVMTAFAVKALVS